MEGGPAGLLGRPVVNRNVEMTLSTVLELVINLVPAMEGDCVLDQIVNASFAQGNLVSNAW